MQTTILRLPLAPSRSEELKGNTPRHLLTTAGGIGALVEHGERTSVVVGGDSFSVDLTYRTVADLWREALNEADPDVFIDYLEEDGH